jgi:hypothetical protein
MKKTGWINFCAILLMMQKTVLQRISGIGSNPTWKSRLKRDRFPVIWWLSGLVVVLLALLVFQHFYFRKKVDALQVENLEKVEGAGSKVDEKDQTEFLEEQKGNQEFAENSFKGEASQALNGQAILEEATKRSTESNIFYNKKEEAIPDDNVIISDTPADNLSFTQKLLKGEGAEPASGKSKKPDESTKHQEGKEQIEKMAIPGFLPSESLLVENKGRTTLADGDWNMKTLNVVPSDGKSGALTWEIGGFAQVAGSNLSLSAASIVRPVNRAVTVTVNQESGSTQWYGLQIKALIGEHFTLESGVAYRQTDILVGHRSSINYGERLRMAPPDWPGRDSTLSDFRYNIPTASGSYEVTVRASDLDRQDPLNDTDILLFNQVISEKTTYLSIPLAMGYQYNFGKWGLSSSAGVWTNFLLQNEVSLERLESLNSRFRVSRRLARPQFVKNDLRKVTLDLALEANIRYEILPEVAVYAGPVWTTSIVQKNKNPFIQSSLQSLGGKAGILFRI